MAPDGPPVPQLPVRHPRPGGAPFPSPRRARGFTPGLCFPPLRGGNPGCDMQTPTGPSIPGPNSQKAIFGLWLLELGSWVFPRSGLLSAAPPIDCRAGQEGGDVAAQLLVRTLVDVHHVARLVVGDR